MDVDPTMQLFDLKTKYQFQTVPGVDRYNMPLYSVQSETPGVPSSPDIGMYPVYQGFTSPAYINGIQVPIQTQKNSFFNIWPNIVQNMNAVAVGNGTQSYTLTLPIGPNASTPVNPPFNAIIRGHVDMTGIMSTGVNVDPPVGTSINTAIPVTSIDAAVFITSIDANGNPIVVTDSGQFLQNQYNLGLLMNPGKAPFGNTALPGGNLTSFAITGATNANPCVLTCTSTFSVGQIVTISGVGGMTQLNGNSYKVTAVTGTTVSINVDSTSFGAYTAGGTASSIWNVINYLTGVINVTFPVNIPTGNNINVQVFFFEGGLPRGILFYNNTLTLRSPPGQQYLVELDAYLSPAAFFNTTAAIPFGYMAEYLARGAARKILSDTGDIEQFQFYEPLFKEQETLVHIRSQRQFTNNRTETLYSQGFNFGNGNSSLGGTSV